MAFVELWVQSVVSNGEVVLEVVYLGSMRALARALLSFRVFLQHACAVIAAWEATSSGSAPSLLTLEPSAFTLSS